MKFVAGRCLNIQNVWNFDVLSQEDSSAATCGAGVGVGGVGGWILAGVSVRRNDGSCMTLRRAGSDYDCDFWGKAHMRLILRLRKITRRFAALKG